MALNLDLAPSRAKLMRAIEHVEFLEREVPAQASGAKSGPYAVRFTPVDPQSGWCEVLLAPNHPRQPGFSVVIGDVVHNLRCSLDYIVTALAEAQGVALSVSHQFPVFLREDRYLNKVGAPVAAPANGGYLKDITQGVALIRDWQPFRVAGEPRQDPLWQIHRFSNADKHREPAAFLAIPSGKLDIGFNGTPVEREVVTDIPNWTPDSEHVICRIRFNPPVAYNFRVDSPLTISINFVTPAFEGEPAQSITVPALRAACSHVSKLIDSFELI